MENFKDLPLWRQCYKIAFPGIYDENDTYEQAEFKKAYKMRDLVSGVVSNNIIANKAQAYDIGSYQFPFNAIYVNHFFRYLGSGSYSYDSIINNDTKRKTISALEFSYSVHSSRYNAKADSQTFDYFGLLRESNYGDYMTLIALKLDNLNRRVKALEG